MKKLGILADSLGLEAIYCGKLIVPAHNTHEGSRYFPTVDELAKYLSEPIMIHIRY